MNNPMSRKLFMNRDAREKLRGMGGIMASSPELAQTVAKFQEGGGVTVPVVPTYSEWLNMSRTERRNAGLPESFIGGQMYFNRFGVGMGTNDPETGLPLRRPEDIDEFGGLPPFMTEPGGTVEEPQAGQGIFPGDLAFDIGEAVGMGPALERAGVEDPVVVRQRRMEEEAAAQEAEAAAAREAVAATMETEAEAGDAETRNVDRLLEAQQRALEELRRESEDADGGAGGTAGFDFDTTYEQMLERVGRVMGEGAKKDDREKAMANLAMIGLAIAAGQSPDALTNIAQGALSGMQAVRAQEAREADLAREARLTALEMAESAADRASRERVAALRLGVDEGGRFSPTEPFVDAVRALAEAALNRGDFPDLESAIAAADAALRPYYTGTSQLDATSVTVPTVGAPGVQLTDTERQLLGL